MAHALRFDHVGITVSDLDAAAAFFVALGCEVQGRTFLEGEFVDTVIGIPDSLVEIVMLATPGGGTSLELSCFVRPAAEQGQPGVLSQVLGLRNISFEVDDVEALVTGQGLSLVGGISDYEGTWRMCQVLGPEGILVGLAQRLDGTATS